MKVSQVHLSHSSYLKGGSIVLIIPRNAVSYSAAPSEA